MKEPHRLRKNDVAIVGLLMGPETGTPRIASHVTVVGFRDIASATTVNGHKCEGTRQMVSGAREVQKFMLNDSRATARQASVISGWANRYTHRTFGRHCERPAS